MIARGLYRPVPVILKYRRPTSYINTHRPSVRCKIVQVWCSQVEEATHLLLLLLQDINISLRLFKTHNVYVIRLNYEETSIFSTAQASWATE